jgi:hypothetical protein
MYKNSDIVFGSLGLLSHQHPPESHLLQYRKCLGSFLTSFTKFWVIIVSEVILPGLKSSASEAESREIFALRERSLANRHPTATFTVLQIRSKSRKWTLQALLRHARLHQALDVAIVLLMIRSKSARPLRETGQQNLIGVPRLWHIIRIRSVFVTLHSILLLVRAMRLDAPKALLQFKESKRL